MKIRIKHSLIIAGAILALQSCSTPKDITYLQDITSGTEVMIPEGITIKVKPGDKLSIVVNSKDPELSDIFNLPVISHRVGTGNSAPSLSTTQYVSYFTVTPEGDIDFPLLGEIHVAGLTRSELAAKIKKDLIEKGLVKDPVVIVEFMDAAIYVMGEVTSPGRYGINRDQLNILEGLSYAGDLTINGQRNNILVLREVDGKQTAYRLDLTNSESLLNSPGYYLQQGDIIYVEPNSLKKRSSTINGNNVLSASFWVSIASLLTSVAVLIFK